MSDYFLTSTESNDVFKALVEARNNIKPAQKNSENPRFKSKYADINAIIEACTQSLSEHNIIVMQTYSIEDNRLNTITRLQHSNGQFIETKTPLLIIDVKPTPQNIGSFITYGRRYALTSLLCLGAQDDDGHAASQTFTDDETNIQQPNLPRSNNFEDNKQNILNNLKQFETPNCTVDDFIQTIGNKTTKYLSREDLKVLQNYYERIKNKGSNLEQAKHKILERKSPVDTIVAAIK